MLGRFQAVSGQGFPLPIFLLIGYQYTFPSNLGRCGHQLYVLTNRLPSWNHCLTSHYFQLLEMWCNNNS